MPGATSGGDTLSNAIAADNALVTKPTTFQVIWGAKRYRQQAISNGQLTNAQKEMQGIEVYREGAGQAPSADTTRQHAATEAAELVERAQEEAAAVEAATAAEAEKQRQEWERRGAEAAAAAATMVEHARAESAGLSQAAAQERQAGRQRWPRWRR